MHPLVRNCQTQSFDIYVGRKRTGMHYGNPFSHKSGTLAAVRVSSVIEAVDAFNRWILGPEFSDVEPERRQWILDHIGDLKGKTLGCYGCQPVCHAEVLARLANTE